MGNRAENGRDGARRQGARHMMPLTLDSVVNTRLMSHPLNWFIVWTTLLFGALAWHMLKSQFDNAEANVSPVAS